MIFSRTDRRSLPIPGRPGRRVAALSTALLVLGASSWAAEPATAAGGDLYVDGSASCSTTGPGTATSPYCTISAAVKAAAGGDTVHVQPGTYREQVTLTTGIGVVADGAVTVSGADDLSAATWTPAAGTAWSTPLSPSSAPTQVFRGSASLSHASSAGSMAAGSWFYDAGTKTLYVDLGGAAPGPADGLEVSTRSYGFLVRGASGATVDGFTLVRQNGAGVQLDNGSSGSTVRGVTVTASGAYGISLTGGSGNLVTGADASGNASIGIRLSGTTDSTVTASTVRSNGFHGVSVQGGSGATVSDVTATGNLRPGSRVAAGIDISSTSTGATVERNTSFRNDDSGIEIYTGSSGATVRHNVTYDNGDHGIDISAAPNANVVSNTAVGNSASGLNVEGGSTGTSLRNNIAVDNAVATTRSKGDIRVDAASTSGSSADRDLVFQSDGSTRSYEWAGALYSTRDALQAATGQEGNGVQGDPRFASLTGRDLQLTGTSPAVDAADSGASGWTDGDRDGTRAADDPQVADTGAGSPSFADLGAYELTSFPPAPADSGPSAALTVTPSDVAEGGTVTLDASGSTDDHGVTGYVFDCGTGSATPSQPTPTTTCTYPTAGTYQASVQVTDAAGQTDTATQPVTVSATQPPAPTTPTAALTATPGQVAKGGSVTLDASASTPGAGHTIAWYRIVCGNGTTSTRQATPTKTCTYTTTGQQTASVTVGDETGQTAKASTVVTVTTATTTKPTARLTVSPTSPRRGQAVLADASASTGSAASPINGYSFKCGGQTRTGWRPGATFSCTFSTAGTTPRITVWVRNTAGLVASTYRTVTVTR
jgi:parallel beta-helix repeat protein